MKNFGKALLISVVFAFIVGLAPNATQDKVLLRRELKEDSKDVYEFVMNGNQTVGSPMGEMPITFTMTMNIAMNALKHDKEKKTLDLELVMSDMKFEMPGMEGMIPTDQLPRESKMRSQLDERNRMKNTTMQGMPMQMQMMMGSNPMSGFMFIEFPEEAVGIGDTWDMVIPRGMGIANDVKLKAKLEGERKVGDKEVYVISLNGTIPINMDMAEMMRGNEQMQMFGDFKMIITGNMVMRSESLVEKESGRTLELSSLVQTNQKLDMPDFGQTVDITGTMSMKYKLKEKAR